MTNRAEESTVDAMPSITVPSMTVPTTGRVEEAIDLPVIDLAEVRLDPRWTSLLSATEARRLKSIVLCCVQNRLMCATSHSEPDRVRRFLEGRIERPLGLLRVDEQSLRRTLARVYGSPVLSLQPTEERGSESTTLLAEIEAAASLRGASDVHILPGAQETKIQFRVDGLLEEFRTLSNESCPALVNRIKVLAGLDIAEKREPQDGRYTADAGGRSHRFDVRVATIPTRFGERVTMRFLTAIDSESLTGLGMTAEDEQLLHRALLQSSGLILLTGPTGSGKSTTLRGAIDLIMRLRGGNIMTVEDPIEYEIQGTTQIEVDAQHKTGFAQALRSILRHDPDVIIVGEIRDSETAELAIRAALTGHLVISTLHTNSASGAVTRLIDMGINAYLVAATLRLVVAQRLVRRLCPRCRTAGEIDPRLAIELGMAKPAGITVYTAHGCLACAGRGFVGRSGLFEMLPVTAQVREMIDANASEGQIRQVMQEQERPTLLADGICKVLLGTTTAEQVLATVAQG